MGYRNLNKVIVTRVIPKVEEANTVPRSPCTRTVKPRGATRERRSFREGVINKWRARINLKRIYNVRDPPEKEDWKICWENIVVTRTEIVSKFKRNILKDHSPQILSRKAFFAQSLSFFTFLLSLIHYARCYIRWSLVFKPTLYKFIVLGTLGLNPSPFGLRIQNLPLQLASSMGKLEL